MGALALVVFGWNLALEPHFVDESAYISQSFYADLLIEGDWNNPTWLTYAGYDLPPLPKYAIGLALKAQGYRRPGPSSMVAWYRDTSQQFVSRDALVAARRPSVVFGALGCLAIYGLGTLSGDRRVGFLAGLLLMANPLYAMHARRAMSDVYAESLILCSLAVGLWAWKRIVGGRPWVLPLVALVLGSGILGGLATLSKLNGSLCGLILAGWTVLAVVLPSTPVFSLRGRMMLVLATLGSGFVSFGTFAALNPFLVASPRPPVPPSIAAEASLGFWGRAKVISDHRVNVSEQAKRLFPRDALLTARDKVDAFIVQGFGRFGPLGPRGRTDSTVRFDWTQDRAALLWLPVVALGGVVAIAWGRRQLRSGEPPTAWAIVFQAVVAAVVVTAFIPLAWDRYFLSIQPGFALLGAFALVAAFDGIRAFRAIGSVGRVAG